MTDPRLAKVSAVGLDAARDLALLLLRLSGALLAANHGWSKVVGLASGQFVSGVGAMGFPVPVVFAWAAALAEFAGGLLVAVGCFTRPAALFVSFTMFVAAFVAHKAHVQFLASIRLSDASPEQLQAMGNPESALLNLFVFFAVLVFGPGRASIDHARRARSRVA